MWKQLLSFYLILQVSVNSVPINSTRNIELNCESYDINKYFENLNCYFVEVSSPTELLNVTSVNLDFESIEKTIIIRIRGNAYYPEYFPKNLAKFIFGVTSLSYQYTPLKYITRNDFLDIAEYLFGIDLEGNEIDELPYDIFYDMPNLSYIHLDHNNLQSLPPNLLANTPELETFHIESNRIKYLHPDFFKNCPKLRTLRADFNQIEEIHEDLFNNNPKMSTIDLPYNKIRKIGIDFRRFEELSYASFLQNQGTCNVVYSNYQSAENVYSNEVLQVLTKSVDDLQKKAEEVCKG